MIPAGHPTQHRCYGKCQQVLPIDYMTLTEVGTNQVEYICDECKYPHTTFFANSLGMITGQFVDDARKLWKGIRQSTLTDRVGLVLSGIAVLVVCALAVMFGGGR